MHTKQRRHVTSITANYNDGSYFEECLNGLLAQTRLPDRIVVVDDKSTDDSWETIKNLVSQKAKVDLSVVTGNLYQIDQKIETSNGLHTIKYVLVRHDQNGGPAVARNTALDYCLDDTDIVAICDCDDYYYPTKIEKSLQIFEEFSDVALVYSDYDVLDESKGIKTREYKEIFSFPRLFEECIVSNGSLVSATVFDVIERYDESLFGPEDYDLWLRISEVAAVYHIPEALYTYRITGNNITVTTPTSRFAEHVRRVHQKKLERQHARQQQ